MKFLAKLLIIFVLLLTSVSATAFSDTIKMNQNDFNVQFYNCHSDSTCSNPTLASEQHVNGNTYTFNYNTNDYYAEYIFKQGYLAKGFIINKYTGINTYNFEKKNNCQANILGLFSDNYINQGTDLNVSVLVASAFSNAAPGTPNYRPSAYSDFFDADTKVTLQLLQNNTIVQESTQDLSIYMNSVSNVNFNQDTSLLNGIYTLRIITNVTDEMCANTILSQRDASLNVFTNTLLEPPVAIAGPDRNVCAGNSVVFDGSSSYDPDGTIISYIWNFGDGNILSGSILNHIYTNPGNYTATLLITDNDGLQSQDNLVVTVNNCTANQNPVANAGPDVTTNVSQNILFNGNNSYDPDGTIISYIWNFGDGNLSSGEIVNHAYLNAGIYNVTLIVTDNNGAQSTDNAIVTVNLVNNTNITLQLTIDADPLNGTAPLKVEFSSDVSGNSPFTYYWDFDDGSHSTQSDPTHIFNKSGTYNVELEVTDNLGSTITKGIIIKVSKNTTTTEDQYNIHSLSIAHVSLDNQIFYPGDIISLNVELLNNGDYTESNIILNVLLTELGLTKSSSTITLSQGSNKYQLIDIQIPEDTKSGLYNLRIKLSNGYTSDIEYKTITILNNDTSEVLLDESNETSVDWLSVVELVFLSLFIILLVVGILLLAREIKRISQR